MTPPGQDTDPSQVSRLVPSIRESVTPPGEDTNPSQVSPQQKLVLIFTAESTGASRVKYPAPGHNAVVRPEFEPLDHCAAHNELRDMTQNQTKQRQAYQ